MRRIALLGAHPASRSQAPFGDTNWEIWACSFRNMGQLPRHDLWFELHEPLGDARYVAWLGRQPRVMVRSERAREWLTRAEVYPEDEMRARFGHFFFTSSIAYMLALAVAQKPEVIGLWGVQMAQAHEYAYQRPGCQYFIQKAWDAGIEVLAPRGLIEPPKEDW